MKKYPYIVDVSIEVAIPKSNEQKISLLVVAANDSKSEFKVLLAKMTENKETSKLDIGPFTELKLIYDKSEFKLSS